MVKGSIGSGVFQRGEILAEGVVGVFVGFVQCDD